MTDHVWPAEPTPALNQVLSLMIFQISPLAISYRLLGYDIKSRAEDEQAFLLHRFIGYALEHGDTWRERVLLDIERASAMALSRERYPESADGDWSPAGPAKASAP